MRTCTAYERLSLNRVPATFRTYLQVAAMAAIFLAHKRRMLKVIKEHSEILVTLRVRTSVLLHPTPRCNATSRHARDTEAVLHAGVGHPGHVSAVQAPRLPPVRVAQCGSTGRGAWGHHCHGCMAWGWACRHVGWLVRCSPGHLSTLLPSAHHHLQSFV